MIAELAREHDLLVVTDEVYEHLVYDGPHVPIATLPGMRERTITISSGGKTFSFTGWKIGWVCAPTDLVTAVKTTKQFLTYVSGGPFQHAIAAGLQLPDEYFSSFLADMREKRDRLCAGLEDAGFEVFRPEGTYFVTADIRSVGGTDGLSFCRTLPERCGVVAIPSVVFYDDADAGKPLVRFACCKRIEVLDEACARLKALRSS
jgi:N-succinyldiaminopimelate aminotransferase